MSGHRAAMSSAGLMVIVPHGLPPLFGVTGIVIIPLIPLAVRRAMLAPAPPPRPNPAPGPTTPPNASSGPTTPPNAPGRHEPVGELVAAGRAAGDRLVVGADDQQFQ